MKKVFFLLCLFAVCVFADNIYMKNGKVYSNVFVTNKTKYAVIFMSNGQKMSVPLDEVLRIEELPIQPNVMPDSMSSENGVNEILNQPSTKQTFFSNPNRNLFFLSILSGLLSWDYFKQVEDIGNEIGDIEKMNYKLNSEISTSKLSDTKSRKRTIAIVSSVVCLVTTYISFTPLEITVSPASLSLSYHF